ncbi:MAG: hypothetical protein M0R77_00065 [Gammaproteobacteria bacterium]|nr:hypothetical protein [Acholeplasmataceae bacterium]MCK9528948.1 hypothetical protein [Gammaproteobacteria bacterium]
MSIINNIFIINDKEKSISDLLDEITEFSLSLEDDEFGDGFEHNKKPTLAPVSSIEDFKKSLMTKEEILEPEEVSSSFSNYDELHIAQQTIIEEVESELRRTKEELLEQKKALDTILHQNLEYLTLASAYTKNNNPNIDIIPFEEAGVAFRSGQFYFSSTTINKYVNRDKPVIFKYLDTYIFVEGIKDTVEDEPSVRVIISHTNSTESIHRRIFSGDEQEIVDLQRALQYLLTLL